MYISCYSSISLTLVLIGRNGGLITLCHSYELDYQQRVAENFFQPLAISAPRIGSLIMAFTGRVVSIFCTTILDWTVFRLRTLDTILDLSYFVFILHL